MFQDTGAGQCAVLGHVSDHDHGNAGLLGNARQLSRTLADLRYRAGSGSQLGGVQSLDGVDHRHRRLILLKDRLDAFELDFRH